MTDDTLPIHLTPPQTEMLRLIASFPHVWHITQVKAESKALDELVTLRLARVRGEGWGRQYRVTEYGKAELAERGE